jgi:hypothetical protein
VGPYRGHFFIGEARQRRVLAGDPYLRADIDQRLVFDSKLFG